MRGVDLAGVEVTGEANRVDRNKRRRGSPETSGGQGRVNGSCVRDQGHVGHVKRRGGTDGGWGAGEVVRCGEGAVDAHTVACMS